MNEAVALLRGMAIGFAMAAPVGPVGLLCIRRALSDGRRAAFIAGLGAAVADTFYGAVAGFGLTFVSGFLMDQATVLRVVGGGFLLIMGGRCMAADAIAVPTAHRGPGLVRDFLSSLAITITNPGTILAFMGVFAALGSMGLGGGGGWVVLGVFTGSAAWWLLLSTAAGAVRTTLSPLWLRRLNQGSGLALLLFGLAVLVSAVL